MPGLSKRFDVLDPNLPLYRNRFLEASAGTGKTFAIEKLILRMLEDPEGPKIEQILVVTFTKAATFELKKRIGHNDAKIFTIHGFCFQTLREFAVETGFALDQVEESASGDELFRIVKDYLRTEKDVSPKQLEKVLRRHQNQIDRLASRLLSIATHRLPIEASLPNIFSEIKRFSVEPYKLLEDLLNLAPHYKGLCDRQKQVKDLEGFENFASLFEGRKLDFIDPPILKMIPENHLKRASEVKLHYPGLLEEMQERLIPALAEASDDQLILGRLAEGVRLAIERAVEKEDLFFYEDLLRLMAKKVEEPTFAQKVREQYRAVFIDEFQDTDPLQWKIFSTLFLNERFQGPLYLVGDPKQAIYQFRGGDVHTYLKAKKAMGNEAEASLNHNYRSDPQLVSALNVLFGKVDSLFLSKTGETIACPPVEAASETKAPWHDERGNIHFFHGDDEKALFSFVVEEIQKLKIAYGDCAVLVKDRFQAQRFVEYCPLPTVVKRNRSLIDSPALSALSDLFGLVVNPHSRNQIAGILWDLSAKQVAQYHFLLKSKGLLSCFQTMMAEMIPSDELYQDMLQLVEMAASEVDGINGILPFLQRLKQEDPESEHLKARATVEADAIQVMTIHMSKGLEFSAVFPLGLALSHTNKRDFVRQDGKMVLAESDASERMRLLYVACTRAKHRLYLPVLDDEEAPINHFLKQVGEIDHPHITTSKCQNHNILPPSMEKPILYAPETIKLSFSSIEVNSYSSIAIHTPSTISAPEGILPVGPESGSLLHKVFEELPFEIAFRASDPKDLHPFVEKSLRNTHLESWIEEVNKMIFNALFMSLGEGFSLSEVDPTKIVKEMEFLYPYENGFLKGFVDLFFEHQGNYYFLDWKSNYLNDYSLPSLEEAMKQQQYHLQADIYREALERYLKMFNHSGCIKNSFYFFLRGRSVYKTFT